MLKKIKEKIKLHIINPYKKRCFLKSENYKKIVKNKSEQRLLLFNTPTHGNLGDHAIALAENQFLNNYFSESKIIEFVHEEISLGLKEILKNCSPQKDIILVHGGGYIGTLWPNEEDILVQLLEQFCDYRIIFFPQTIYFEKTEYGNLELNKIRGVLKKCKNITFFTRDRASYEYCINNLSLNVHKVYLVPDIVTYYSAGLSHQIKRKKQVLVCFRKDKEKSIDSQMLHAVQEYIQTQGYEIVYTDTVVDYKIYPKDRKKEVISKLQEFSKVKLVLTDRLHGMLFSALTSTPCIAFDNMSKKVSGCYKEWLNDFSFVKCVLDIDDIDEITLKSMVDELLVINDAKYDNKCFEEYYYIISDAISKVREG